MILADTSVWVDHFRRGNALLAARLTDGEIACHAFVLGELACGGLRDRKKILAQLADLPDIPSLEHEEVHRLIEARGLFNRGLGWTDMHILAAALVAHIPLWTLDKALSAAANQLGVSPLR